MQQKSARKSLRGRLTHLPLWKKILIGLFLGFVTGTVMQERAAIFEPIGTLFLNAIRMVIVPVVFSSIACGVMAIGDTQKMGRIWLKMLFIFLATMGVATVIGIVLGELLLNPAIMHVKSNMAGLEQHSLLNMLTEIIPANPVQAFASNNVLQIIVFAILFGIAVSRCGDSAQEIEDYLIAFSHVAHELTGMIMQLAPFGVFALIASVSGSMGFRLIGDLGQLVGVIFLGCLIQMLVVYSLLLIIFARVNPWRFFLGTLPAIEMAFSTTSSIATLPANLHCTEHNLGVSQRIAQFILPIGATANMNGLSVYLGAATVFTSKLYGLELTTLQLLTVIFTSILAAMGAASIPGSGITVMTLSLSAVGLPLDAITLIAAVDRIIDMATSTTNTAGNALTALLIARSEGEFDRTIYNTHKPTTPDQPQPDHATKAACE